MTEEFEQPVVPGDLTAVDKTSGITVSTKAEVVDDEWDSIPQFDDQINSIESSAFIEKGDMYLRAT